MKKLLALLTLILMLTAFVTPAFATGESDSFRVIGYYSGDLFDEPADKLQFDKLTHIMYAFLVPKEDGTLEQFEKADKLTEIVKLGHEAGCQVFVALGGWSYKNVPLVSVFEKIGASDELRAELIKNVTKFVVDNDLDGVELDWEHPNSASAAHYEKLTLELHDALEAEGKQLTAALNGAWSATEGPAVSLAVSDACLDAFDFISVMGYDINNTEHSPLWFSGTSIEYWVNRNVPREDIVIGVPLYARPSYMQYRHLIELDRENAYREYVATEPLYSYYNSLNTLREKTLMAMRNAGGIMLFDVNEDTFDDVSVVSMIAETRQNVDVNDATLVVIDNVPLYFNADDGLGMPFVDTNNRTLIPIRKALESVGASVSFDNETQTVSAVRNETTLTITIGENSLHVDGMETVMDTAAVIKDGRTYIPLRAVFEAFGYTVTWSQYGNVAYVASPPKAQ